MSFLGKLLIAFQLVLSIVFLAFAGAVFSTQQNWKILAETNEKNLKAEQATHQNDLQESQQAKAKLEQELKNEKNRADGAEGSLKIREDEVTSLNKENVAAKTERDSQRTLAQVATEEARQRRDEALQQRAVNNDLHKLLTEKNDKVKALEDVVFNKSVEEKSLTEKHSKLLQESAILQKVLAANGLSADPKSVVGLQLPPPTVQGEVLETKRGGRAGSDLVEISLGLDDGLVEGHKLSVYRPAEGNRAASYLGEIRIVYVTPDRSVGVVVARAKNGIIAKGDNVTSKL